jgi:transposase
VRTGDRAERHRAPISELPAVTPEPGQVARRTARRLNVEEASGRFAGVDWANDGHSICAVESEGSVVIEFDIADTATDVVDMCRRLNRAGVRRVAIERPDGPVVDALLKDGLEVVVVASRSVKALRLRYGTTGNKSDHGDAYVLADCLRTDGHRWASLEPDSPATVTLRTHVRARKDLVEHRVAVANQLRAHLKIVFPGVVGLFSDIDSPISLAFLRRFPSERKAAWLSEKRLAAWLRTQSYGGRRSAADLYRHLTQAPQGLTGHEGDARSSVTLAFVTLLETIDTQIKSLKRRIAGLLDAHPDGHIFRSLPRAGTIRAATLLAEIGDCRARFPEPEALACLAGVTPSTRASGKHRAVTFRWAANKKLRDALCDFAGDTPNGNEWARHRYRQLRSDGKSHPHAERILARTWTHIIWRCWQDKVPYDPARHGALQELQNGTSLT